MTIPKTSQLGTGTPDAASSSQAKQCSTSRVLVIGAQGVLGRIPGPGAARARHRRGQPVGDHGPGSARPGQHADENDDLNGRERR